MQSRQSCWRSIFLNACIALAFQSYFLFTYLYHMKEVNTYYTSATLSPLFFQRYSDFQLSFAFLRERIINGYESTSQLNFSLPDRNIDGSLSYLNGSIDNYYHMSSMSVEN